MDEYARALADAIEAALPGWVAAAVRARTEDAAAVEAAADAGRRAVADVMPRLRALLEEDVDAQRSTPLAIVRSAVRWPTQVLRDAGVERARRDDVQAGLFPEDEYDLAPASFADLGPAVHEAGIAWGAAKAMEHMRRHRRPGDR